MEKPKTKKSVQDKRAEKLKKELLDSMIKSRKEMEIAIEQSEKDMRRRMVYKAVGMIGVMLNVILSAFLLWNGHTDMAIYFLLFGIFGTLVI